MAQPPWLPDLELLQSYSGNWANYEEALYQLFLDDFVRRSTYFRGSKIALKRHPEFKGKSATFWHITSEGKVENERTPDLRRCERIRWPRPLIENCNDAEVKVWEEMRNNELRVHIWLEQMDYLLVLAVRNGYYVLWTAFYIDHPHQRKKYEKRFEAAKIAEAASSEDKTAS